jgi:hypothetical protein
MGDMNAEFLRCFRALAWLRWRMLLRTLSRGRGRDIIERFSLAAQTLLPIVALILMVPAALGIGAIGFLAGFWVGQPAGATLATIVQSLLLFACGFTLFAPLVFPAGSEAAGQVRLLLLPVPRGILYLSQTLGVLVDPWLGVLLPLFVAVPLGFALSGRPLGALVTLVAGIGMIAFIVALAMVSTSLLQLLLRNRRRGERAMVAAMLGFMLLSMLPSFLVPDFEDRSERRRRAERTEPVEKDRRSPERRILRVVSAIGLVLPPGQFTAAARAAAAGEPVAALGWTSAIVAGAAALHAVGWRVYRRLIETPASTGARRRRDRAGPSRRRLPGLSEGTSAVAWAFARLCFRTPRGKIVVFSVVLTLPLLSVLLMRADEMPFVFTARPGLSIGMFGLGITLLSLGPLSLNQFASDGAGLTLQSLAPISDRELLVGKAVGGALVLAGPAAIVLAIAIALSPSAPVAMWLVLAFGAAGTYAVLAPINATLSAIFPRKVNLASIGRDSNPHQAANFLGFLAVLLAASPAVLAAGAGVMLFRSEWVAALLVGAWAGLAIVVSSLALRVVERLVASRRENLLFVAQGR